MKIKRISLILALALMLSLLAACGGGGYRDDVSMTTLENAVDSALGGAGSMIQAPASYVESTIKLTDADFEESCIKLDSQGININEYGIFKTADKSAAKALETKLKDYLQYRLDIWMPEYMPEELPKLENATVTVAGNYLMYSILDDSGRDAVASAFEDALKK